METHECATAPGLLEWLPWPLVIAGGAGLLAVLVAWGEVDNWGVFLRFLYQVPYGESDPVFDQDFGFYLFRCPPISFQELDAARAFPSALFAAAIYGYAATSSSTPAPTSRRSGRPWFRAAWFLLGVKAGSYGLDRFLLLYGDNGVVVGAGYTDIHVELPVLWLLIGLSRRRFCVVGQHAGARLPASRCRGGARLRRLLPAVRRGPGIIPARVRQTERVAAGEALHRTQHRADPQAYDLHQITTKPFPAEQNLTFKTLEADRATIDNIRLWDWQPLMDTYAQLQEIRTYYKFHDVDVDRYRLDGAYQSVMLSARELKSSLLPPNAQTWVNRHVLFTHGNGVVMCPVTRTTAEGLPLFYLRDIPPVATGGPEIREPRIYYGEETDSYVIVKGSTPSSIIRRGKTTSTRLMTAPAAFPWAGSRGGFSSPGTSTT